jgi:diguanylate cyclase (GGDEF)-like protein/PAS domain S-box-containing protein
VIVTDSQNRILYLNPVAESLLSLSQTNALGQPLELVSASYGKTLGSHLTGEEQRFEMTFDGDAKDSIFEVSSSPIHLWKGSGASHGPPGHVLILHDITARKETEELLSRREAIMGAINFAAEQFLKESAWEHTIPGVLEKLGRAVDASRVYVFMNYSDEQGVIRTSQCYEWAAPGIAPQINNPDLQHIPLREAGFGRWEETLAQGKPIYGLLRDFPESEQRILSDQQIVSIAVIPIFVEGRWWGFIGFDECRYEREWTTSELDALHTAANIFGSAETRARTEQKLLRRQRTLNLMQDIVLASLQSSDLSKMAHTLVDHLGKLINADGCFLSLWNEEHKQVVPLAAYGPYREKYPNLQVNPGEKTFTASAIKMGRTLVVEDVSNSPYVSRRITSQFSSRSVIVLPLIAGVNRLGAIILSFDQPHRFQPEEIAICEQAVNVIALALEKFQAVEHARRRAEESETLRKAGAAVTETLHAEEAIPRILEQLLQVIPYDSASVQLLDGNELEIVGGRGWENPADVIGVRFPVPGDNPNTVVIQTGKPYILTEADKAYPAFRNPPHSHIRSWLGVPLIVRGRTIGMLAIDSSKPNYFKEESVALVSSFADQVAIALENAQKFKETKTQAVTDALTGIYNRRGLFEVGEYEFARARRLNRPFSAIMIDIDHFKRVNDNYGHGVGDQALVTVAERCRSGSRTVDLVGRYGGEEFLILMPESSQDAARLVAERLRHSLAERPIPTEAGPIRITISAGVSEMRETDTLQTLIERADEALYEAKNNGRNRVACAD